MNAYDELVERCETAWLSDGVDGVLAETLRTLEVEAAGTDNGTHDARTFRQDLISWLRSSPLGEMGGGL